MGGTLSVCGLGSDDHDPQLRQSKDFKRDCDRSTERGRSFSATTDSSVASILSSSDQLIPDAYLPKDIQVLSQRRQRSHHHHLSSRSHGPLSSSRVGNSAGTAKVLRKGEAETDKNLTAFGVKTASSSFGDDPSVDPPKATSGRLELHKRLSSRDLMSVAWP